MSEIQEAINFFERCGVPYADEAAAALKYQAEREKGCEYCNDPGPFYDCCYVKPDGTAVEQRLIQKSENMFDVFVEERNINFCPMCGRDLRKPEDHAT